MSANYSTVISIICTIITSVIAFLTYKKNMSNGDKDAIEERVKRDTTISTKLDLVITGNVELKSEIKYLNNKFDDINERVARCEENTKHAHDRIDKLEDKLN